MNQKSTSEILKNSAESELDSIQNFDTMINLPVLSTFQVNLEVDTKKLETQLFLFKPLISYLMVNAHEALDKFASQHFDIQAPDLIWYQAVLTHSQSSELWQMILKNDPSLELAGKLGCSAEIRDMGLMGHLLYCCETYGELVELNRAYLKAASGDERIFHFMRGNEIWLEFGRGNSHKETPLFILFYFLSSAMSSIRQVVNGPNFLVSVNFPTVEPSPEEKKIIEEFFLVPVQFGSDQLRLIYDNRVMDLPLKGRDPVMRALLLNHLETTEKLVSSESTDNFLIDVRSLIRELPKTTNLTADHIAQSLSLSRRTLDRRLAEEGVTFNELKEDVLKSMAISYLQNGMSIANISKQLGFANLSSFSRAFKRWTNMNPRGLKAPRPSNN